MAIVNIEVLSCVGKLSDSRPIAIHGRATRAADENLEKTHSLFFEFSDIFMDKYYEINSPKAPYNYSSSICTYNGSISLCERSKPNIYMIFGFFGPV